jgi:hypothetical protein
MSVILFNTDFRPLFTGNRFARPIILPDIPNERIADLPPDFVVSDREDRFYLPNTI